jgi:Spy/CpxP family protein refolding chaperone
MSFKRKFISAITLTLATVAFTTFVSAQDAAKQDDSTQKMERRENRGFGRMRGGQDGEFRRGGKHRGGDRMLMRSLGRLNLSDAQKEQARGIFENFKKSSGTQREEMRGLAMKKRDGIITAEEQTRLQELKSQMRASSEQVRNSILTILTAEQRTQLEQMKEEMKQRRQERRLNRQNRQQTAPSQDN